MRTADECACRRQLQARGRVSQLGGRLPNRYAELVGFERNPVAEMPPVTRNVVRGFADDIDRQLGSGAGLWLMGPAERFHTDAGSTGLVLRTCLAVLVAQAAIQAGHDAPYYSMSGLFGALRGAHAQGVDLSGDLARVDLLVIDGIDEARARSIPAFTEPEDESSKQWVLDELFAIVNAREEAGRSILVTSRLLEDENLAAGMGELLVSRLSSSCTSIPV